VKTPVRRTFAARGLGLDDITHVSLPIRLKEPEPSTRTVSLPHRSLRVVVGVVNHLVAPDQR